MRQTFVPKEESIISKLSVGSIIKVTNKEINYNTVRLLVVGKSYSDKNNVKGFFDIKNKLNIIMRGNKENVFGSTFPFPSKDHNFPQILCKEINTLSNGRKLNGDYIGLSAGEDDNMILTVEKNP